MNINQTIFIYYSSQWNWHCPV